MRVIKVLFLLAFFFVCMLFFVQNTAILETPLILKLGAFGFQTESSAVPFYVVLLLSFVAGGLFATLYFLAEKVRLATGMRSLQNKVNAMEKQLVKKPAAPAMSVPSYAASPAPSVTSSAAAGGSAEEKAGA
jgi:lipopolysaccharide assembly protein A